MHTAAIPHRCPIGAAKAITALAFLGLLVLTAQAQPPTEKTKDPVPSPSTEKTKTPPVEAKAIAEKLNLPPGTIIFFSKDARELQKIDAVILTREQFKDLTDQLEQYRRKTDADKAVFPSVCKVQGKVESRGPQSVVRLVATFEFETTSPRTAVFVGCAKVQPSSAKLDDNRLPLLASTDEGLTVFVEQAGRHTLVLELEASLSTRGSKGAESGFELGLPRAPITRFSFEPVPQVSAYQLTVRRDKTSETFRLPPERLKSDGDDSLTLGAAESLDLAWEPPAQSATGSTTLSATADIQVTIDDAETVTTAKLRLRGGSKEWKILAPMVADLTVSRPAVSSPTLIDPSASPRPIAEIAFDPPPVIRRPTDPNQPPIWTVQFKDRVQDDVIVTMTVRTPRSSNEQKSSGLQPIGPFAAIDVFPQQGSIRVLTPQHLRVMYQPRPEVRRIEAVDSRIPANGPIEATFRYNAVPTGPNNLPMVPLEIDVRAILGTVQTETRHELRLSENGCKLRTDVEVTPIRAEVDRLEFDIPPGWENLIAASTDRTLIEGTTREGTGQRKLIIKLARPKRTAFQISLDAIAFVPLAANSANLRLPRVLSTVDRSGRIEVEVPATIEMRGTVQEWEGDQPVSWPNPLVAIPVESGRSTRFQAALRGSPTGVDLVWNPYRPKTVAESRLDLTLRDRQAIVVQQLVLRFAESSPAQVRLRGPADLTGVRLVTPGMGMDTIANGEWLVSLGDTTAREATLTLSYSFPLPSPGRTERAQVAVPFIWAEGASRYETRLRVWRDSSTPVAWIPTLSDGPWIEQPIEPVADREVLPALVLSASGSSLPLTLGLTEAGLGPVAQIWIERALVQTRQSDAGLQDYRVRFLIRRWLSRSIELQLPAPPILRSPEFYLDDKRIETVEVVGSDEAGLRTFRVPLAIPRGSKPTILEVRYQLLAGRAESAVSRLARWNVDLIPPVPRGPVMVAATRWQIALPERWTPLDLDDELRYEQRYGIQNGLLAILAGRTTTELDQWFTAGLESLPAADRAPSGWDAGVANLTGRQVQLSPIHLLAVPRTGWLFLGTTLTLIGGLLIWRLPTIPRWISLAVMVQLLGAITFGLPQVAAQLLVGSQVGILLLVVVLGIYTILQRRYRRRVTFMPGFTRQQGQSSKVIAPRRPVSRELSTVDSPQAPDVWANEPAESTGSTGSGR